MKELFDNIVLDNEPRYLPKLVADVDNYTSWTDVEYCLNNPQWYTIEFVHDYKKIDPTRVEKKWCHPVAEKKQLFDLLHSGMAFIITKYSFHNEYTNCLTAELEDHYHVHPDLHIYGGLEGSGSFAVHNDYPANIIIQAEGSTPWKIWKDTTQSPVIDVVLTAGDVLYIPPQMYHAAEPIGRRLSMSIPLWPIENNITSIDRNFYRIKF